MFIYEKLGKKREAQTQVSTGLRKDVLSTKDLLLLI